MSKEMTPISVGAIPTLERLMTDWEKLTTGHPHLAPFIEKDLEKLKEMYNNMDRTKTYIIAMGMSCLRWTSSRCHAQPACTAINPTVKFLYRRKHRDPDFIMLADDWVKDEVPVNPR
jgi:hypothetical protein